MGDNLFRVLLASIKAKVTPFVTKVKMWTSWNFIRTRVITKIRDFFTSLLDVKPRHKKDYYSVFGWLVSRRLAMAVVVAVGVLSLYYLFSVQKTLTSARTEGIKTYDYDSIMLRFAEERVRIRGKSGYLAYEGDVKNGSVTGYGTLYNREGVVVYQGNFDKNRYQGNGTRYYDNGTLMYTGNFQENLFDGTGRLYRENGSLFYEGEFALGKRDGNGKLYDNGSNLVYTGGFSQDELLYSSLLGKKVSEMADIYKGKRTLYESSQDFVVVLEDIDAMYVGQGDSQSLDDEMAVEQVLVLKDSFGAGGKTFSTIEELKQFFGAEDYEGNSEVTMQEAVAINWMADHRRGFLKSVKMEITSEYDDYFVVEGFDPAYTVYIHSFRKDGLIYTFICQDREDIFSCYSIEKEEGEAGT
jgi:antitoxin component YwqK of YwqJK toxin-antitoxin module